MNLQQSGFVGSGVLPGVSSNNIPAADNSALGAGQSGSASTVAANTNATPGATARKQVLNSVWSAIGQPGQTGGIHALAAALTAQLAAGLASGKDLAPQLAQSIDTALSQVAQQLTSEGVNPAHAERLVGDVRQQLANAVSEAAARQGSTPSSSSVGAATSPTPSATTSAATTTFANAALNLLFNAYTRSVVSTSGSVVNTAASATSTTTSAASNGLSNVTANAAKVAVVSEAESLTINTTSGAQVTIHFAAAGAGVMSQGNGSTNAAALSIGGMQVSVSGNLSGAAAQAVSNLLSQVDSLASQFFSGDAQDAFAAAANLSVDPGEIAGMNMSLMYTSNTYLVSAASSGSSVAALGGILAGASGASTSGNTGTMSGNSTGSNTSAVPSGTGNASDTNAATNGTGNASDTTSAVASGTANTPANNAATTNGTASNASPQQTIITFLREVMAKLGRNTSAGEIQLSSSSKLQLLALALPAYGQQTQGTQLAAATLNQMAA